MYGVLAVWKSVLTLREKPLVIGKCTLFLILIGSTFCYLSGNTKKCDKGKLDLNSSTRSGVTGRENCSMLGTK